MACAVFFSWLELGYFFFGVEVGAELLAARFILVLAMMSVNWLRVDLPCVITDLDFVYATYLAVVRQEIMFQQELMATSATEEMVEQHSSSAPYAQI